MVVPQFIHPFCLIVFVLTQFLICFSNSSLVEQCGKIPNQCCDCNTHRCGCKSHLSHIIFILKHGNCKYYQFLIIIVLFIDVSAYLRLLFTTMVESYMMVILIMHQNELEVVESRETFENWPMICIESLMIFNWRNKTNKCCVKFLSKNKQLKFSIYQFQQVLINKNKNNKYVSKITKRKKSSTTNI